MSYIKTTQCPYRYRHELIKWLTQRGWKWQDAIKLKKKQMYAIYYNNHGHKGL